MTRRHLMVRWLGALGLILALTSPSALDAKGSGKGASGKSSHAKTAKAPKAPKPPSTKIVTTGRARLVTEPSAHASVMKLPLRS
jgi:hypothetical protein